MKHLLTTIAAIAASSVSALGGRFSAMEIVLPYTVNHSVISDQYSSGLYTGLVNLKASIPDAEFVLQTSVAASVPNRKSGGASASVSVSAQFNIYWTQTILGEAPPSVLYHHHSLTSTVHEEFICANGEFGIGSASVNNTPLTGCSVAYDSRRQGGNSSSLSASNISTATFSFVPVWVYVSTDQSGMSTYVTMTPVIASNTAYSSIGFQSSSLPLPGNSQGSANSAATDSIHFDDQP